MISTVDIQWYFLTILFIILLYDAILLFFVIIIIIHHSSIILCKKLKEFDKCWNIIDWLNTVYYIIKYRNSR